MKKIRNNKSLSEKINMYSDEITKKNFKNFKAFAFGGMILTGLMVLAALPFREHSYFTSQYFILFFYFVICNLYIHCFLKNHIKYTICSFYVAMMPILLIGILMGTFWDPESNAITIMIMLCTLFMFIADKPQHIIGYILVGAGVFLVCSFNCKSIDLFISDVVNLLIYLSIGISVNMLTLTDRVGSMENYILAAKRADSDALTSILNRGAGDKLVQKMLNDGQKGAMLIIDIDDFKSINDCYGHQTGDSVICEVSRQLSNTLSGKGVVWRLGGDEFAVFATDIGNMEQCEKLLHQIQENIAAINVINKEMPNIKVSIGCSLSSLDTQFEDMYKISDDAIV